MPISITCDSCSTKLKAPDNALGRKVKCPKCSTLVPVPGDLAVPPVVSAKTVPTKSSSSSTGRAVVEQAKPPAQPAPQKQTASLQELLDPFEISATIKDQARKHLTDDERVIWLGKPLPRLILVRSLGVLVGGLVAAIALAIILRQSLGLALLAGGALLAIAVGTPLLRSWRATRTLYVLTQQRATVWEPNRFGMMTARDYTPDVLSKMFRRNSWFIKGAGDLVFRKLTITKSTLYVKRQTGPYYASHSKVTVRSTTTTIYWGFLAIDDVAHVEQLVNDQVIAPYGFRVVGECP